METKFGMIPPAAWFILSFLIFTSFECNTRKSGEIGPFQFYYFEGSYYVISQPATGNPPAMSIVGCTNLAKPNWLVGEWNSTKSLLNGECVILYGSRDCQSSKLEKSATFNQILNYSEFSSFHLCSFSNSSSPSIPSSSQSFRKTSQYVLYDYPYHDGFLSHYDNVENCTNLKDSEAKRVGSFSETNGNCLHLYEERNCRGQTLKAYPTIHNDLSQVGWADRASSIKACGTYLNAKITRFRPISTQEDLEGGRVLRKTGVETSEPFINNGSNGPILASFKTARPFKEIFSFGVIQALSSMESAEVMNDLSVEEVTTLGSDPHICFPVDSASTRCMAVVRLIRELKSAYQFRSPDDGRRKHSHHGEIEREFPVYENFTIPPCSGVEVTSFVLANKNLSLKFELGVRISGENRGKSMTSDELRFQIKSIRDMTYLKDLNEYEIYAKMGGSIMATVGVRAESNVRRVEDPIPGCVKRTSATREPKSSMWNDTSMTFDKNDEEQLGGHPSPLTLIIGGIVLFSVLSLCLLSFCIGRNLKDNNKPSGKEFQVIRLGGYVLVIEFGCCAPC